MHIWICSHICNSYILTAPPPLLFWIICRGSKESFRPCGLLWAAVWCLGLRRDPGFHRSLEPAALRPHLIRGSVKENILFGRPGGGIFCPPFLGGKIIKSWWDEFSHHSQWCFRKLWITRRVCNLLATAMRAFQRLISHSSRKASIG